MPLKKSTILKIHKKIGENVKKQRKLKGMSQLELSYNLGHKSVGVISTAEIGIANKHFNISHLANISQILEINIETLFVGVQEIIKSKN